MGPVQRFHGNAAGGGGVVHVQVGPQKVQSLPRPLRSNHLRAKSGCCHGTQPQAGSQLQDSHVPQTQLLR
eukprot:CAMPEP_0114268802 /NCGR_PEP_ID=MMETSP0058-20121206/26206_1 /TAXON_ID=36894 /ORGANISM="Pyramimonas parkeae, CCMP726" /LENGTH=69 /DNA_ID=CAMNT_0001387111 /DNA_START=409 /DNA_END=618 /DNA_ORIENTATION=+